MSRKNPRPNRAGVADENPGAEQPLLLRDERDQLYGEIEEEKPVTDKNHSTEAFKQVSAPS